MFAAPGADLRVCLLKVPIFSRRLSERESSRFCRRLGGLRVRAICQQTKRCSTTVALERRERTVRAILASGSPWVSLQLVGDRLDSRPGGALSRRRAVISAGVHGSLSQAVLHLDVTVNARNDGRRIRQQHFWTN